MKKGYTKIVYLLDSTSVMAPIRIAVVDAMNDFILTQRALPGHASIHVYGFNKHPYALYKTTDMREDDSIQYASYVPSKISMRNDVLANLIHDVGIALSITDEDERPDKVIIIIHSSAMTDYSTRYNNLMLNQMIKHQIDKYNWTFLYLCGSAYKIGPDDAVNYGIPAENFALCRHTGSGVKMGIMSISNAVKYIRYSNPDRARGAMANQNTIYNEVDLSD